MTSLTVVESRNPPAQWDAFVRGDANGTFCHQAGWAEIMSDVMGHDSRLITAVDETGAIHGLLPLVRVRNPLGHFLISMPFLNDGGPIGEAAAQKLLVEFAVKDASRSGADLLELRARYDVPGPVIPAHRRIAVHLRLPGSVEGLWKETLRTKQRTKIRRSAKEGMYFQAGAEHLEGFYEVFARNMRDLGTPVLSIRFFQRLSSIFKSQVVFGVIYTKDRQPVAAACCLLWRDEVEVTWGSSLREFNHLSPNMLLYCSLMEHAIGLGLNTFNFGRCAPGGGTHDFKLQWGGKDIPLPWPTWSRSPSAGVPSAASPLYRFATAAWKKMPIPVANRVGPKLARLLP